MAQGSRQVQTQAQQQIQTLSPQQILVVKLLELPAVELEDRVRAELLENPALEEGKEDTPGDEYPDTPDTETGTEDGGDTSYDSLSDYLNEDDIPDCKLQENNRNVPELRMSRDFTEMVEEHTKNRANQSKESREAMMFLKQKMDAAQGFIDAVKQRQNTLMTTMQAIIDLQRPFFLEGDESLLRPMILKDVAERTGLDISTISRVSNSKYVQTNYGIYPLKFFFNDGYTTEDGEEMSVREIRKILKECIDNEDKKKPLTDDELTELLKEKGYPIARRTVAKYRQQMNIPVARLRR